MRRWKKVYGRQTDECVPGYFEVWQDCYKLTPDTKVLTGEDHTPFTGRDELHNVVVLFIHICKYPLL